MLSADPKQAMARSNTLPVRWYVDTFQSHLLKKSRRSFGQSCKLNLANKYGRLKALDTVTLQLAFLNH